MDINQIKKLIQLVENSQIGELKIEETDFKIKITHRDFKPTTIAQTVAPNVAPISSTLPNTTTPTLEKPIATTNNNHITIKAPMIGTFYRSSSPDKEPFVKVGDTVKKGDVLCVIEAMKLFNEIQSEFAGKIIKVLVDNNQPIEYEQDLFIIEP